MDWFLNASGISQAVCILYIYVDDSCLVCRHKDIHEIEKPLNEDFSDSYI